MAVLDGCESKYKTPALEERVCPECGEEVEVFTVDGKITADSECSCGYVFRAESWGYSAHASALFGNRAIHFWVAIFSSFFSSESPLFQAIVTVEGALAWARATLSRKAAGWAVLFAM